MQGTTEPAYFSAYRSMKLARDTQGVLVLQFHTDGGPLNFTAHDHTDFVDAFYRIAQDRANKIVILTGRVESSFQGSTFHPLATLPTRLFGAKFTMKVFSFSRIWQTFACPCSPQSTAPR